MNYVGRIYGSFNVKSGDTVTNAFWSVKNNNNNNSNNSGSGGGGGGGGDNNNNNNNNNNNWTTRMRLHTENKLIETDNIKI